MAIVCLIIGGILLVLAGGCVIRAVICALQGERSYKKGLVESDPRASINLFNTANQVYSRAMIWAIAGGILCVVSVLFSITSTIIKIAIT